MLELEQSAGVDLVIKPEVENKETAGDKQKLPGGARRGAGRRPGPKAAADRRASSAPPRAEADSAVESDGAPRFKRRNLGEFYKAVRCLDEPGGGDTAPRA